VSRHSEPWLPTSQQIAMASERAILAALDANLQLASRALLAEHPSLDDDSGNEEPAPPQLSLAASIRILAETLHELIAGYRAVTDQALGDVDRDDQF